MYSENNNDFYTKTGYKLHYKIVKDTGNVPLVLIHGQGMCGQDYEKVFLKLSKKYILYLVDCFGHGDSSIYRRLI